MALSLRGRLLAAHAIMIVAALAIMTLLASREQRHRLIQDQQAELEQLLMRAAPAVARQAAIASTRVPLLADSLGAAWGCRVTLIDASGWVRGDSQVAARDLPLQDPDAGGPEMRAALAGRIGRAVRAR